MSRFFLVLSIFACATIFVQAAKSTKVVEMDKKSPLFMKSIEDAKASLRKMKIDVESKPPRQLQTTEGAGGGMNMCKIPEDFNSGNIINMGTPEQPLEMTCGDLSNSLPLQLGATSDSWSDVDCQTAPATAWYSLSLSSAECCGAAYNTQCAEMYDPNFSNMCKIPEDLDQNKVPFPDGMTCAGMSLNLLSTLGVNSWSKVDCQAASTSGELEAVHYYGMECCGALSNTQCASEPVENPEVVKPGPEPVENPEVKPGPEPVENPEVKPGPEPVENPEDALPECVRSCVSTCESHVTAKCTDDPSKCMDEDAVSAMLCSCLSGFDSPQPQCMAWPLYISTEGSGPQCSTMDMMQVFAYLGSYHCDLESENNFASGNGPKPVENPEVKPGPEPVENPEVKPGPEPVENPEVKPNFFVPKCMFTCMEFCEQELGASAHYASMLDYGNALTDCMTTASAFHYCGTALWFNDYGPVDSKCFKKDVANVLDDFAVFNLKQKMDDASKQFKSKMTCGPGLYIRAKNKRNPRCEVCRAGKYNRKSFQNKRCKKCPKNTFTSWMGSDRCEKCPWGFDTKGQKGKKQCFHKETGESMKKLGYFSKMNTKKMVKE